MSLLLLDKYRPRDFGSLDLHPETSSLLRKLTASSDFPHLLLYGPSGSGKKTRALAAIRELFGPGADKTKVETRTLKAGSTFVDVSVVSSSYHIELTPTDLGNKDAAVVQQLIKETAQSPPPITTGRSFKVVLINDACNLSRQAQAGLRRTMEKYIGACRIILIAESLSRLIAPVKSRCLCIRVGSPTVSEIERVLTEVVAAEGIRGSLPLGDIASSCSRDLRRALLMVDAARLAPVPTVVRPPWEAYAAEIARDILAEQSPKQLLAVRGKLYDLLCACVPGEEIFKVVHSALISNPRISMLKSNELTGLAAKFEHSMRLGTKPVLHLEGFCAKAMAVVRA